MDVSNRNNQESGIPIPGTGFILGFGAFCVIATAFLYWLVTSRTVVVLPETASVQSKATDNLFYLLVLIGGFVFFLVQGMLLYTVIRFRARPGDTSDGSPAHGNMVLEIVWTIIPTVVVFGLAVGSFFVWRDNSAVPADPNFINGRNIPIHVTAQRFDWSFQFDTGEKDVNGNDIILRSGNLHTYVGQNLEMNMNSLDVIHSMWVPALRIKQDVIPGRTTQFRVTLDSDGTEFEFVELVGEAVIYTEQTSESEAILTVKPLNTLEVRRLGTDDSGIWVQVELPDGKVGWVSSAAVKGAMNQYRIVCAELCGGGHGQMFTYLYIHETEESFLSWYNTGVQRQFEPPNDPVLLGGQVLPEYPCDTCHTLNSLGWAGTTGPILDGIGDRAGDRAEDSDALNGADYIMQSLRHPQQFRVLGYDGVNMPTFSPPDDGINDMTVDHLVGITAYLCTQTASGNPQDNTCGLEFADDGTLVDIDAAMEYLQGFAAVYAE